MLNGLRPLVRGGLTGFTMLTNAKIFFHLTLLVSSTTGGTLLHAGVNDGGFVQVGEEEGSGGEGADVGPTVHPSGEEPVQRLLRHGTQDPGLPSVNGDENSSEQINLEDWKKAQSESLQKLLNDWKENWKESQKISLQKVLEDWKEAQKISLQKYLEKWKESQLQMTLSSLNADSEEGSGSVHGEPLQKYLDDWKEDWREDWRESQLELIMATHHGDHSEEGSDQRISLQGFIHDWTDAQVGAILSSLNMNDGEEGSGYDLNMSLQDFVEDWTFSQLESILPPSTIDDPEEGSGSHLNNDQKITLQHFVEEWKQTQLDNIVGDWEVLELSAIEKGQYKFLNPGED